ncbi:hypothetical protein RhiirB3_459569, partial [Rhizophagus irregularis]
IESSSEATTVLLTVDFTLQTLQYFQGLFHNKENVQHIIPQRNRFGIVSWNGGDSENNVNIENSEHNENDNVIPLQQQLIDQITDLHVTRIQGAPCKKKIKSAIEMLGKNRAIREITSQVNVQETDDGGAISRS